MGAKGTVFWATMFIGCFIFVGTPDAGGVAHGICTVLGLVSLTMLCMIYDKHKASIWAWVRSWFSTLNTSGAKVVKYRRFEKPQAITPANSHPVVYRRPLTKLKKPVR